MIYDDDEGATNDDTLNLDIILELHFARSFEFSKNACTPDIHDSLLSDGSTGVPCRDLFEFVRAGVLTHFVLGEARVDSDRAELILVRIIADLAKVVSSTCPKLTAVALPRVIGQE